MHLRDRDHLAQIWAELVSLKDRVIYAETRPVPDLNRLWVQELAHLNSGGTFTSDCSGTLIASYAWADLLDPSGNSFSGAGNTDSFLTHLARATHPMRGSIGVFGAPGQSVHAVGLLDKYYSGPESIVFSHGQSAGPFALPLSAEIAAHPGQPFTWLSVASL